MARKPPRRPTADPPTTGSKKSAKLLAEELREYIGTLDPGTSVSISGVRRHLGGHHRTLPLAFKAMVDELLLIFHPGRGYLTTGVDASRVTAAQIKRAGIVSVLEFRLFLEPAAASEAARLIEQSHAQRSPDRAGLFVASLVARGAPGVATHSAPAS